VFTTPRRGAINRATFNSKSWWPALRKAGIVSTGATGMHALRHFYALGAARRGGERQGARRVPRTRRSGVTLRVYTHLMPSSEHRARSAIDDLFGTERDDGGFQ
jgi:hypothetical protein